jgi:hypothetical protein
MIWLFRRGACGGTMTDFVLKLDDKWILGCDELQWVLCRRDLKHPISFISSTKIILHRCIREAGCQPTVDALATMDGWPDTFAAWRAVGVRDGQTAVLDIGATALQDAMPGGLAGANA